LILVKLSALQVERLIECRKTKLRGFEDWEIESLLDEAVLQFYEKYGKKHTQFSRGSAKS